MNNLLQIHHGYSDVSIINICPVFFYSPTDHSMIKETSIRNIASGNFTRIVILLFMSGLNTISTHLLHSDTSVGLVHTSAHHLFPSECLFLRSDAEEQSTTHQTALVSVSQDFIIKHVSSIQCKIKLY